jgi:four helix bundle protein
MINKKNVKKYDLEERTARFGEKAISFCKKIPKNPITNPLISQFIKCSTSIGANYCEADDAESKADFRHKIGICKKESREAKHFARMIGVAIPELKKEIDALLQEAKELNLIFNSIFKKVS